MWQGRMWRFHTPEETLKAFLTGTNSQIFHKSKKSESSCLLGKPWKTVARDSTMGRCKINFQILTRDRYHENLATLTEIVSWLQNFVQSKVDESILGFGKSPCIIKVTYDRSTWDSKSCQKPTIFCHEIGLAKFWIKVYWFPESFRYTFFGPSLVADHKLV